MEIITPTLIADVAWEGALEMPAEAYSLPTVRGMGIIVTIGKPEIWPAGKVLEDTVGAKWNPPMGAAFYWLVRLACTLRKPPAGLALTEAMEQVFLRPKNSAAGRSAAYAFSLYPDRIGVEQQTEFDVSLGPELKFGSVDVKAGSAGAKIQYRQVFPAVQSYEAGTPNPYWIFRPHATRPLEGTQFVYAVVAAQEGADGARASLEMTVTAQSALGPLRYGLPQASKAHLGFTIP